MTLLKGLGSFFALDIGTNAVRVVQLSQSGPDAWSLQHYGYAPVDERITTSNSPEAIHRLGEVIMTAVGQSGIKEKDVIIGLPSSKTFTTVIDVPTMAEAELKSTIKYQIDQYIPMSVSEAKVDWALLGQSLHDPKQQEVLLASTANSYAEERLEFVESLGFNVIAAEPDPIAMIRSLLPSNVKDARLIIDVGEKSTDLAITFDGSPRLVRTIPTGLSTLIKAAVQNLNVQEDQARQFILKFGLAPDRLEGQVYRAIESTLDNFATELIKSVKFFQTRYPNTPVSGILLSGFSAVVPQFGEYVAAKTGIVSSIANPWQRVKVSQSDQQQLAAVAYEFATVIGLAQKKEREMIEINLIPDVKLELVKAKRFRAKIITVSVIIGVVSVATVGVLASYAYGVQTLSGLVLDSSIDSESKKLEKVEDLSKTLTIQNQLSIISALNDEKKIDSRIFNVLKAVVPPAPNDVKISDLSVDSSSDTISMDGQASGGYAALEVFKKTIAGAKIKYLDTEGKQQQVALASDISTTDVSYGEDSSNKKVLRFTLSFVHAEELFAPSSTGVSVVITSDGNVTDSYLGIPRSIFTDRAADIIGEE